MADVTTITGEVEEKKREYQEKAHADKWSLKIDGVWVSMLKPKQEAMDQGWEKGKAWEVAEMVMEGQWVKCGHEGQYKNITYLWVIEKPVGAKSTAEAGGKNEWIAYESLMSTAVELLKHPYYADIDKPHKEVWSIVRDWIKAFPAAFKEVE